MGNETFYGDGLSRHILPVACLEDIVFKKESLDDNHKNKREDEDGSKWAIASGSSKDVG